MSLPKLNEPKIKRALQHIKRFPEAYDQNDVASSCEVTKKTPCGTIGCFGGWLVLLDNPKSKRSDMADSISLEEAQDIAGFTEDEADYVFDSASGDPKKDYKTVVDRVNQVRAFRKLIEPVMKMVKSAKISNGEITFETSDNREINYYLGE